MDAKSKANFINSVAGGQGIPCPNCNTLNEADSRFCIACGTPLSQKKPENAVPFAAAEPVQEPTPTSAAASSQEPTPTPAAEPSQEPAFAAAPSQEKEPVPAAEPSQQPFPTAEPSQQQPFAAAEPSRPPVRPRPVQSRTKQAEQPKSAAPTEKYVEPESVFAEGLPSWDIEPPQVVVRRKRR